MLSLLRLNAARVKPRHAFLTASSSRSLTSIADEKTMKDTYSAIFTQLDPSAPTPSPLEPQPLPVTPPPIDVAQLAQAPIDPSLLVIPPAQDPLLHYLTSKITHDGKRSTAARKVARVLMHIHAYTRAAPLPILREAISAASPAVKVVMYKKGAKQIGVPMPLNEKQRTRYGVEWILMASEKKSSKLLEVRLAREIVSVVQGNSEALKKKEEVHKFAMLNRGNVPRGGR
ncbi:ribosomal protein S7 [Athelia psychrophila]|uniref:Ribosomal protein S7 n=2 Tax=Athelia psychrophila TaxID=1759441 RepID=A0A166DN33_9AGAM|nr:ribosomal protein S7 [Fibularhizoctonia sp. CBS 109695]